MAKFKQLAVWQNAVNLNIEILELMVTLPKTEIYSLQDQCKRSSLSISSNIAEGSGRGTDKDFSRFLKIALGSSYELESQLIVIETSYKIPTKLSRRKLSVIQRQLRALIRSLSFSIATHKANNNPKIIVKQRNAE